MRRRWAVLPVGALLVGMILGLLISRWQRVNNLPSAAIGQRAPFVPGEWEYPKAKAVAKMQGGSSRATQSDGTSVSAFAPDHYGYSTPDPIGMVWSHYAKLSGITGEFTPGRFSSNTDSAATAASTSGSAAMGGTMYYTGDRDRTSVHSAMIVVQRPAYTATVFITRSADEDQTHIDLVVEQKPTGLSR